MMICLALSELGVRMPELISSPSGAPTLLILCLRGAWPRSSLTASSCEYRFNCCRDLAIPWRSADRASHAISIDDRHGSSPSNRIMDADRGNPVGLARAMARVPPPRASVDVCPNGHPRCRPGAAWTWRLVDRCSPIRLEANPHS